MIFPSTLRVIRSVNCTDDPVTHRRPVIRFMHTITGQAPVGIFLVVVISVCSSSRLRARYTKFHRI